MKKIYVLFVAYFLLCSLQLHGEDRQENKFREITSSPYDVHLARQVETIFNEMKGAMLGEKGLASKMKECRGFSYNHSDPYCPQWPQVTQYLRSGDCKDRALWLLSKINDPNIFFVIGKKEFGQEVNHAWLLRKRKGQWWILDCLHQSEPRACSQFEDKEYMPLYAYSNKAKYVYPDSPLWKNNIDDFLSLK